MKVPTSLPDFQRLFPDEAACAQFLANVRWPDGFVCPNCGATDYYKHGTRRTYICAQCKKQTHLTAGTIMHKSKMPLLMWFYGIFIVTTLTPGISAVQFQKMMGLSRYETAYQMLHKIRSAMVNPEREPLHGVVEIDETYLGGVRSGGKGGRALGEKILVIGAVELRMSDKGRPFAGRVRFRVIPRATAKYIDSFVQEHVQPGAFIVTDGWRGYTNLRSLGYDHRTALPADIEEHGWLRLIHLEFSNLKTYIQGTYHGRVEQQHLQTYLNEFAFRHNRRFWPGSAFLRVLQLGMGVTQSYDKLYSAENYGQAVHIGDYLAKYGR